MSAANDFVQNHLAIAPRFRTESSTGERNCTESPLFFIGSSPSQAATIINPAEPAAGVMVSANQLWKRKSDFLVNDWVMDSGAFTEVARHGGYRYPVEHYYSLICRWWHVGKLLIAVAQDWMCEPDVLNRTGLTVSEHQRLTIERYDQLLACGSPAPIMPVLQGYQSSDYLSHLQQYDARLLLGAWVGVGSVCRRNGNPDEVANLLRGIKLLRPDLRLHGFGLKVLALENPEIRSLLYSCDSMAWSYPLRFKKAAPDDNVQNHSESYSDSVQNLAQRYQQKVACRLNGSYTRTVPRTAGAGNGQGRKPKWRSGKTVAIRVPEQFAAQLLAIARDWDSEALDDLPPSASESPDSQIPQ